ncbi:hypothetical protein Z043_123021 [Scleropages formosus]|uniref:Zona pellucida sperm-binding protein 4-like n=1 Tax=Scleropages formosus TaxID=113540 RepID=A0A0P7UE34_SCLFO|nr:hypothetical protein Z043_123021 [Scleropages formosus]
MFCREEGTVLLIFTVGITFCTFRPCRGADTNDLSDAPGKGAVGVEGWLADTSSRLGTFWKWRQLEKTRESAGAADLARDWLETSSRARPHTDTSSRYNAAPTPEYLSEGLRRDRDKRGTAGGPQPHIPREWEDMRPVVECGSNVMTVTARGRGNTHLLIARENGPPISFFELPSNCGYSVKITWQDLVLKAPYDGCHVLKENDNYILPLLWWGTPVKVACPVKSALPRSHVSVSCLPLGMSLKIKGQQVEANKLWIKLNGKWVPSMSAQCVYRIEASPGEVVLYLPYSLCDLPLKVPASYPDCTGHSFPSQSLSTPIPNRPQTEVMPSLTCLTNIMTVKLPSAHPDSLRVMGPNNNWVPISTVPPSCAYKLISGTRGVILSTPLPACHTRNLPSVRSFLLMFWDAILGRYRTLELRCPTPSPLNVPSVPTHPPIQTPIEPSPLKPPPFLSPTVFCSANNMRVELPPGPIWSISIKDVSGGAVRVKDAPKQCGYNVNKGKGGINILVLPFNSCHMTLQGNEYRIHLRFQTQDGQEEESVLSCPVHSLITKQECSFPIEKRIPCGPESCSRKECDSLGCCFSSSSGTCFYPMDECTVDHHFVFSVPASIMDPPLNPASLFVASNNSCTPQKVTPNFALFKIPLVGCGAHRYEIGQTVVYMLEILNIVRSITLGYGTITRDSPLRLLVECRFVPGSRVTVGYLVKTPSLGPSIQAHGTFGVQLRIATDEHYTSFYPQYHRPLRLLLGKPLHLEVRLLNPPDPNLVLLVHYCLAYPRSAQATWVLIYDG